MSAAGWLLSLLAGVACAGLVWWLWRAWAPPRLRYLQPYQPPSQRGTQEPRP